MRAEGYRGVDGIQTWYEPGRYQLCSCFRCPIPDWEHDALFGLRDGRLREHLQSAQRRRVAAFDAELGEDVAKVLFHRQVTHAEDGANLDQILPARRHQLQRLRGGQDSQRGALLRDNVHGTRRNLTV